MTELIIKLTILIINNAEDAVLYTKGVAKIYTCLMMMNLYNPILDVTTVE